MEKNMERNKPCWCGSGKKYKRCHLNREQEPRLQPWEADQGLRLHYGVRRCMAPESLRELCSGNIVRAHTVPKSGSLSHIAQNGHVYAFIPSVRRIVEGNGVLRPELLGISRASTFTGFCGHHDKELFAPIEDVPIDFSQEQCFLLGYRAMVRELFLKEVQQESIRMLRDADRGLNFSAQVSIQQHAALSALGIGIGVKDLLRHKGFYDGVLLSRDFSSVCAYVMTFHHIPTVMCSGGLFPYENFNGGKVQDFANLERPADAIHYTSFAAGDVGAVIFTWLSDSDETCGTFIQSLEQVPDKRLSATLIRFFFEYCENTFISPVWWDSLDTPVREALIHRINNAANPEVERRADCLLDDGIMLEDWGVHTRYRMSYS